MLGIKKTVARIALMGSFALAVFAQSSTAQAASHVVLPSKVRAVRTPSKPPKLPPPIGISATGGTLVYLKPHHRDPAYVFVIKLSRAAGKMPVTVSYMTSGSNPLANTLFDNVSGVAIFHGTALQYKVYVPVVGPLTKNKANFIALQLSNPFDAVISHGQGLGYLVSKGTTVNRK
jgi:hypothetical protein